MESRIKVKHWPFLGAGTAYQNKRKYRPTDGFRGEANVTLTADHAYKVGRFLGWYFGELKRRSGDPEPPRVVIGRNSNVYPLSCVRGVIPENSIYKTGGVIAAKK